MRKDKARRGARSGAGWRGPRDEVFIPQGAVYSVKNIHDGTTYWLYGYD